MMCYNCGNIVTEDTIRCDVCGAVLKDSRQLKKEARMQKRKKASEVRNKPRGMKWFKFQIYFRLYACAFIMACNAVSALLGLKYIGVDLEYLYGTYKGLRIFDIVMGIIGFCIAVIAIYTRMMLARFKKNGPLIYYILVCFVLVYTACGMVIPCVMTNNYLGVIGGNFVVAEVAVVHVLDIVLNYMYFKHRKNMFVN